jgi:hypothetical protein
MRHLVALGAALALLGSLSLSAGVAAQDGAEAPHPMHIHQGVCPAPGDVVVPLTDLAPAAESEASEGVASAIPVEVSVTSVDLALADILAAEHSINAHESADAMDIYIACGDIGGAMIGDSLLAIGLAEQNASGHSGIALLNDNEDGTTTVSVYLMLSAPTGATESPAPAASPVAGASAMPEASPMGEASPMPEESSQPAASAMVGASAPPEASPLPEPSPAA